ncbi:MAG: putative bifunctional diguanylate cyclase/phosphodiesterase, partial [Allosphingosinicella sp.]
LVSALILNVALVLLTWRRSSALGAATNALRDAELRATESASTDYVTGLSNRRELATEIAAVWGRGAEASLLLFDLDHFKKVNDLYGHGVGDSLLRHVGDTLRQLAPPGACCARLGGDEFALLLSGPRHHDRASDLAGEIVRLIAQPVAFDGRTINVSASVGIASLIDEVADAEALLRRSDIAMYEAKRLGRNRFVMFDSDMERALDERSKLEAEMRAGIERKEFVPYYQPQMDLRSGTLKGFEVLARWQHPTRGLLEPLHFIEIAESSGLIASLSLVVMHRALIEARDWPAELTIAVNVSPVQFRDPLLAQHLLKVLTQTGFPPARLELEITESSILEDQEQALATVTSLKNNGISISLDDFGTGYASLTQLKALPFDRIKIDKSFVAALLSDAQSGAIVRTIAGLGASLELPVTAEGVESEEVCARLKELGCGDGQGWLWSKAVPAAVAAALIPQSLKTGSSPPADSGADLPEKLKERRNLARRAARRSAG